MKSPPADSDEAKTARVRLMALLALYDRLPPSIDGIAVPDFNPPPNFDSAHDTESIIRSLEAISQKLHIKGLASLVASVRANGQRMDNILYDAGISEERPPSEGAARLSDGSYEASSSIGIDQELSHGAMQSEL